MSKLKAVVLDIIGQLFNKTVSITRDAFLIAEGITQKVDGVVTKVTTKYLTGTTGAGATTLVPHGIIDAAHILDVSADLYHATDDCWCVEEYKLTPTTSNGYAVLYNDTNIIFDNVGVSFRGQPYKISITYIVD
jgi:hypothetical protein